MNITEGHRAKAEIRVLFMTLMKMSARARDHFFASRNIELSGMQYGILHTLSQRQFTLSDLSKLFVLDPSTLLPVVDTLEQRGLVERERDPNDRRRVPLRLTSAGADLLKTCEGLHADDMLVKGLTEMGEEKTQQLLSLLRELVYHMPDGESILRDIQEQLSLPESQRCPQRIPSDHV